MAPVKLLIIGHSHVRRLETFINNPPRQYAEKPLFNFGFDTRTLLVEYVGVGGLKVHDTLNNASVVHKLNSFRPDSVILMIGDNDVRHSTSVNELAGAILNLATEMKLCYRLNSVSVVQLLPRFPGARSWDSYDNIAFLVNQALLEQVLDINGVRRFHADFCFLVENKDRFWNLRDSFRDNGVHLNDRGNYKLHKALFSEVLRALRIS